MMDEAGYRLGMVVAFTLGLWEGVIAIVYRAFTDKGPGVMTAVNYLPSPWCYVAGAAVVVAAAVIVEALDRGRKRLPARRDA
ncbi:MULTISPECIES: hypothetical protein [Streptomyces]|uniref:hypothetical protein n=1 Tax=Streptomyces TaxID=1883 RepID=UPI00163C0D0F|nr:MULTISPECIES: hypothetical protein [Streptomyces]MBC2879134.1 hypothetical protein [Streptomyces sp. TYQ1024]UBI35335.1 hypothetical protein K7I03_01905 [Streptomyces mobaraensis]UKW27926.1 hypothetical protein MCU78_01940 [Streptomyces sp. TYQ1024]